MNSRKIWALGLAGLCSAASLAATPPAMAGEMAATATCAHPSWKNKDADTGKVKSSTWVNVRTGTNSHCPVAARVSRLNVLGYDCYTVVSKVKWTHVTTASKKRGWLTSASLNDGGSKKHC